MGFHAKIAKEQSRKEKDSQSLISDLYKSSLNLFVHSCLIKIYYATNARMINIKRVVLLKRVSVFAL